MSTLALQPTADTQPYWNFAARGSFVWQRCSVCGSMQNVPRSFCAECRSDKVEWVETEPKGKIVSISRVFRAPNKLFSGRAPYTLVLVELDAGFRLMFNLIGDEKDAAAINDRVEIFFGPPEDDCGFGIPQARRA